MRAAIYTRVSTDDQTTENQRRDLLKVLMQRKWVLTTEYTDEGISGAKGRAQRPGLDALMTGARRGQFDVVLAWSVDRLGRSLADLIGLLGELEHANVGLYLHQQNLDTTTPAGKAMFQMVGVFAEFERSMIQERVKAGLRRAVANGAVLGPQPKLTEDQRDDIRFALEMGESAIDVAARYGVNRSTIYRIKSQ